LARATLVSNFNGYAHRHPSDAPKSAIIADESYEGNPPHDKARVTKPGGISDFRRRWVDKGLSENAIGIVEKCRRDSSTRTYSTPWNRWVLWCRAREENPFECDPIVVVNFLSELFHEGFMYRTLGVYRSAISAYHDPIEGIPVGQSKIV